MDSKDVKVISCSETKKPLFRSEIIEQIKAHKLFKRMEHISQLGLLRKTHGATHTRAEHCIGTYELTLTALETIIKKQPQLLQFLQCSVGKLSIAECILVGAICHDIGHFPFSHFFDAFPGLISDEKKADHEYRADRIIRNMGLGYSDNDYQFINHVIQGKKFIPKGSQAINYSTWAFEIVANHNTEIDTDKMDYIKRDWKIRNDNLEILFDADELLSSIIIVDDHIYYRENNQITNLVRARFMMHRDYYHMESTILLESLLAQQMTPHTFNEWLEIAEDDFKFDEILKLHNSFVIESTTTGTHEALATLEAMVKKNECNTAYITKQRSLITKKYSSGVKGDKTSSTMLNSMIPSWTKGGLASVCGGKSANKTQNPL